MRKAKTLCAALFLALLAAPNVQARDGVDLIQRLDAYFNEAVVRVQATDDPAEKRAILRESFDDLSDVLHRIEKLPNLSEEETATIADLQKEILQKQNRLEGDGGLAPVPNNNLDRFAQQAQQDFALADRQITIGLTTLLLILIILILLL